MQVDTGIDQRGIAYYGLNVKRGAIVQGRENDFRAASGQHCRYSAAA